MSLTSKEKTFKEKEASNLFIYEINEDNIQKNNNYQSSEQNNILNNEDNEKISANKIHEKPNVFLQKRKRTEESEKNFQNINMNNKIENKNKFIYINKNINDKNKNLFPISLNKNKFENEKLISDSNQEEFINKKYSLDLTDDINSSNIKKTGGCNCKNSGCLKRYCECFSRIKYCDSNCQCQNCCNNINNEKERNEIINNYLIKSPISFKKMKINLNNFSCHCKKSNCLKNYCECFQLGLKCSKNCGCFDCKNKDVLDKKMFNIESYNNRNKKEINKNGQININKENKNNINVILEKKVNGNNTNNENKNHYSVNFIVDKNFINNKKSINRFISFGKSFNWNNLNLKRIQISKTKLIIDNYNINNINNCNLISMQIFQPKIRKDLYIDNIENKNSNNIIINKNSAFNAII